MALTTTTLPAGDCLDNDDCQAMEYCNKEAGDCGGSRNCKVKPQACPLVDDPVCGCDGKTYMNACFAAHAGVNVASDGSCGCCV